MNAPAKSTALAASTQSTSVSAMSEDQLINVLRNSLYVGAQTDSIKMVLGYCQASGLDPMQKPVHIVPVYNAKANGGNGGMVDVVMPGVGLYRTMASRTGQCAGVSEPEFGADVTDTLGGVSITYPAWCKVVVKRLLPNGSVAEYAATERWKENYAMKGGKDKSIAPNAMWTKRPYGQIAKCAEAQALRKAFPELTGSAPTAEEMEGKEYEGQTIDATPRVVPEEKPALPIMDKDEVITRYGTDTIDGEGVVIKFSKKSLIEQGEAKAQTLIDFLAPRCTLTEEAIAEIKSWEKK